jgi:hypothetical protein
MTKTSDGIGKYPTMPPRSRTLIEDARKIRIQSLYNSGKIKVGQTTSGHLLAKEGPRFTAFLGGNSYGWLQIGNQKWALESRQMHRISRKTRQPIIGGIRLYLISSNDRRHSNLFLTADNRVGTVGELGLIWKTKRLSKSKRALNRRRKLLRLLRANPGDLDWVKQHPDYPIERPRGMSRKRFTRLIRDGVFYPRKRLLNKDREVQQQDLNTLRTVLGL